MTSPLFRQSAASLRRGALALAAATGLAGTALDASAAATIVVQSRDPAGIGFNDPTPVAPVGGNPGTTLGEQRMYVYRYVADIWAAALDSSVTITVNAGWEALSCTATSAVLGSAGAWNIWADFPGGKPGTWYPQALANKLSGLNLPTEAGQEDDGTGYGNVDIKTQFNVNLGKSDCLAGSPFYLGINDYTSDKGVNFVATLLHELGHGLGFSVLTVFTNTGERFFGLPSIWEGFMFDNTLGKTWLDMSDAERQASTINFQKLAWTGAQVNAATPATLAPGFNPHLAIGGAGAGGLAGSYTIGTASFGPALTPTGVTGQLAMFSDTTNNTGNGLACTALSAANAAKVAGKVAIVDRGTCAFSAKTKNLQNAGAIGVVVANNVSGIINMSGTDASITIPAVSVSKEDGLLLKASLLNRRRGAPAPVVMATLAAPPSGTYAGADPSGRPLLYTPNPREPGSSVSHWDRSASPNLLMEPSINPDLTTTLTAPKDLTLPLLKDLGW